VPTLHERISPRQGRKGQAVASEDLLGTPAVPGALLQPSSAIKSPAGDAKKEKRKREKKEKKEKKEEKRVIFCAKLVH
jgi:ribosomal protein L12E/L44/L45/RPP1/RPP2